MKRTFYRKWGESVDGLIVPNINGDWIDVVNTTNQKLRYMIKGGVCYVLARIDGGYTTSWQEMASAGSLPLPPYQLYPSMVTASNEFLCGYIGSNGNFEYKGNRDGTLLVSYPI